MNTTIDPQLEWGPAHHREEPTPFEFDERPDDN